VQHIPEPRARSITASAGFRPHWILSSAIIALLVSLLLALTNYQPPYQLSNTAPAYTPSTATNLTFAILAKPLGDTVDFVVRRNDTLESIFRHLRLNLNDLTGLLQVPELRRSLARIKAGEKMTLVHDNGVVHEIKRRVSDTQVLTVTRTGTGFAAELVALPVDTETVFAHGTISSSLFAAARAVGVSPDTTLRLANDLFGWDIDFALDIRPGDRFAVIYEKKYSNGNYIGDGRILAATFVNGGKLYRAVHYASADGKIEGYFSPEGRSMRRQFLRAPLDFTRVSSGFSLARLHPLWNTITAHQGVDYVAPTGTVIKAAADGRVDFLGPKGGYGKTVILEHGGGRISTLYAHMSRFADGLRDGQRVRQGQTIGYVGSTGASTGPHLHYEYRVGGIHMNPRTVPLPAATPIPAEYLADFHSSAVAALAELEQGPETKVAAADKKPIGAAHRIKMQWAQDAWIAAALSGSYFSYPESAYFSLRQPSTGHWLISSLSSDNGE